MFRNFEKTSDMVEKSPKCAERLSPSCRRTQSPVIYRCFGQGLGCSFGRPNSQWTVVGHRGEFAYKHSGIEGSVFGNNVFPDPSFESKGLGGLGQCNSGSLPQQTGGGTHSLEMCFMIWHLIFCNPRAILLRARHVLGCLNVIADSLSRRDKIIQTEWSLHPKIFQGICQIWHGPMVDMFATKMNNKLPLYVSPVPDPNAMAVDALNISWQALDGYAYCPVALIPKLVQKMRTYACRMIVVAPGWPGMSWFWDLIELSTKPPLLLPHWETLLKQPFSHRFHQNLQYLNLHVWHLDSRPNHLKDSLSQWQRELRHLKDVHQEGSMNQGGPFFSHGANRVRWSSKNLLFTQ